MTAGHDGAAPLVFVTVGGDHHPFQRLMSWVERWLRDGGSDAVRCVVQHGPARPPQLAECWPLLEHDQMLELMTQAAVVVSSGGPATLAEARRLGHRPIAVPRRAALHEVVDDHQWAFTARLDQLGYATLADNEERFRAALVDALSSPAARTDVGADNEPVPPAVGRVATVIDSLLAARTGRSATPLRRPASVDTAVSDG